MMWFRFGLVHEAKKELPDEPGPPSLHYYAECKKNGLQAFLNSLRMFEEDSLKKQELNKDKSEKKTWTNAVPPPYIRELYFQAGALYRGRRQTQTALEV